MPKAQKPFYSNRREGDAEGINKGKFVVCTNYRYKDSFLKRTEFAYYSEVVFWFGFEKSTSDQKRSSYISNVLYLDKTYGEPIGLVRTIKKQDVINIAGAYFLVAGKNVITRSNFLSSFS